MSILTGKEIIRQVKMGRILIDPFDEDSVGTNSMDMRWGSEILVYRNKTLDMKGPNPTRAINFPKKGVILRPGKVYLMATIETAGSDYYRPAIETRSTPARLGLSCHLSAGYGDIGWIDSTWTLEVTCVQPIRVYPNEFVCQVEFSTTEGERTLYRERVKSKYQGQRKPTPARMPKE